MAYRGVTIRTITESDINGQLTVDDRFQSFGMAFVVRVKADKTLELFMCASDDPAIDSIVKMPVLEMSLEE